MGPGSQTPPDTEQAKALAQVAAERYNRYQDVFVPLENQYMGDVLKTRNEGAYDTVGAEAAANYAGQFGNANHQLTGEMEQQGVDPTSGVFMGNSAALRKAQAVKSGLGISGAKVDNTNRFYTGLSSIIAMGQGQSADAMGGLESAAKSSTDQAMQDAADSFNQASATRQGIGTMVGLGVSPIVDSAMHKGA